MLVNFINHPSTTEKMPVIMGIIFYQGNTDKHNQHHRYVSITYSTETETKNKLMVIRLKDVGRRRLCVKKRNYSFKRIYCNGEQSNGVMSKKGSVVERKAPFQ